MEEILNYVKALGVGCRHPHDKFLKEANNACQPTKAFGIYDFENEDFYHKPYLPFFCHIPGCDKSFETVIQYESHYNSCHSFTCSECKKNLPNYHLLDLHISETHDSFFLELAKRKPMFQCFVQECKDIFATPQQRRNHCIEIHKYPSDFRFDAFNKGKSKKNKTTQLHNKVDLTKSENSMDIDEKTNEKHERKEQKPKKSETKDQFSSKGFKFGHFQSRRKPVFHNFTKDLIQNLPE